MKNAPSGTGKPRIPFAPQPEYDVVWHGAKVSPSGEKGQLLPETHAVGSTWDAGVEKLKRRLDAINKRDLNAK